MRLTVQHFYDFGSDRRFVGDDLVLAPAWDALRTETEGPFALPRDRPSWERTADERPEIRARAVAINRWLKRRGVDSIASYGAGAAALELWLHRLDPDLRLEIGEYAP